MRKLNTTNLEQFDGGFRVKQGDLSSSFGFKLLDENKDPVPSLDGQEAKITLTKDGEQWKHTSTVTNGAVVFNLDGILPEGTYKLEISVAGYVFPSDDSTQIRITKSDENLVTEEVHALKELDIAEEVKKQLAGKIVGNNVTLPLPDNVGHEIRGTGSPEGRITAEIGTTYVDVNMTNGALKWIKQSGTGNTGWKVIHGDTGWVLGWQQDMDETLNVDVVNRMYFRRINDVVHVKFEPKIQTSTVSATANLVLENGDFNIMHILSINGFRPINDIVQTIFQTGAENSEVSQGTGCVIIQYYEVLKGLFVWQLKIVASKQDNHVNPFSYLTEDDWPTQLP